jgi:hypothetical protein
MDKYQIEAIKDHDELSDKQGKLSDFMHQAEYGRLPDVEQGLLMVQIVAMNNYLDVLNRRIELFTQ